MRRLIALTIGSLCTALLAGQVLLTVPDAGEVTLGGRPDSLKFSVIGDMGNGAAPQYDIARQMAAARRRFPFELVLMTGDNMLGSQQPRDFGPKFEQPYRPLLDAGVRFYAALGNHDDPSSRFYPRFNMQGDRYYTFAVKNVRFFAFDTNALDRKQLAWIESALKAATEPWRVVFFHHPLYSNGGRHGSNVEIRVELEPMLVAHGVQVVFAGHDHVYERLKPQKGITHFVIGSSGELRKGDLNPAESTAKGYDQDRAFTLFEVSGNEMAFEAISRTGTVVDAGIIRRPGAGGAVATGGAR
jgi:hypothetical protein